MRTIRFAALLTVFCLGPVSAWSAPAPAAPPPPATPRAAADPGAGAPPAAPPAEETTRPTDPAAPPADTPPGDAATPADMTPRLKAENWSHRHQVGIAVAVGAGYSFLVTYRDSTWCGQTDGDDNASFCTGMHPVHLDFELSYGILNQLDAVAEFRLGLMDDPVGNKPLIFMPGLRVWIDPQQKFKIGIGFQLVLDFTKQGSDRQDQLGMPVKGESMDLGGRVYGQFQYDFNRYVGLYGRIGAMATARRWVQVNLSGQIGVQSRFP